MQEATEAHLQALAEMRMDEYRRLDPMVERVANERVRELLEASGEPVEVTKYKEPVMYYEPAEGTGGLPAIMCTCGRKKSHLRMRVLQRWAEKHYLKTGHKPVEETRRNS